MWFLNADPLISLCGSHLVYTVGMYLETLHILMKLGLLSQCSGDASPSEKVLTLRSNSVRSTT